MKRNALIAVMAAATMFVAGSAAAQSLGADVDGVDSIYPGASTSGAQHIALVASATTLTFTNVSGMVVYNNGSGDNPNDADGIGSASALGVTAGSGVSGISADHAGFLAGVFVSGPGGTPTGAVPSDLDFRSTGIGTAFTALSPLLNQAFFIGDGLTGDGTGSVQQFFVPTGATTLLLGFADAAGYFGSPGSYADNSGYLNLTVNGVGTAAPVPEPASWAMMLAGVGLLGFAAKRRAGRQIGAAAIV